MEQALSALPTHAPAIASLRSVYVLATFSFLWQPSEIISLQGEMAYFGPQFGRIQPVMDCPR